MTGVVHVSTPADLGIREVRQIADGACVVLAPDLLSRLAMSREQTLAALDQGLPVYGVTTGMGLQSNLAVGADDAAYQGDLMLARAVGTEPWLDRRTTRAVIATRLRTLLDPEAGISPALATALADLLDTDSHPAVPEGDNGAVGEIIPLAHLGGFLTGRGEGIGADGALEPAAELLRSAGLTPYEFAAKEGVAFLQGIPVAAAQAVLLNDDARLLAAQSLAVAAAEVAVVRAPRDPYDAALARGDHLLGDVLTSLRDLAGDEPNPRMLQAPVSFRVVGPALAHLLRSIDHLGDSTERALTGVSTSPALLDGRFLGTAGFDGFDLAATMDAARVAVLHVADVGAARLHRMLDPRVSGLNAQLSAAPGRQAGLVAVHKRVVGRLHAVRRAAAPASLGATETSLGQEDVQSFALESAHALHESLLALRDGVACELLAVHQAHLLDDTGPRGSESLQAVLHKASEGLGDDPADRPFGRDVAALTHVLGVGWAHDVLTVTRDAPSRHPR